MEFIKDPSMIIAGVLLMLYIIIGWQWMFMIISVAYVAFSIIRYRETANFWFIFLGLLGVRAIRNRNNSNHDIRR